MKSFFTNAIEAWNKFWFSSLESLKIDHFKSSFFRLCVGTTTLIFYSQRFFDFDFLFSEKGLVSYTLSIVMVPDLFKSPWVMYPANEATLKWLHIALLVGLFLIVIGVGGRIVKVLTFGLHIVFMQRNAVVMYGPDFIASCWLLYLILLDTDKYLSIKNWFKKQSLIPNLKSSEDEIQTPAWSASLNSVGLRMVQIQMCTIYGYGGLEKLKGLSWWRGDAVWNTLGNGQLVTFDFSWLAHIPIVIVVLTYSTLFFEIYFPALIWNQKLRKYLILFGVSMHLSIAIMMNIPFFSTLMICGYIPFFTHKSVTNRR